MRHHFTLVILFIVHSGATAQVLDSSWRDIIKNKDESWFRTTQARDIAENVLLYQRNIGGWPKNIQMQQPLSGAEKEKLKALKPDPKNCTTDNGATVQEMLFLSKMYRQVPDERYKEAFIDGLKYLLDAQYDNGGWPQFYPLRKGYYSHITYNDDSMVNILNLLREIKDRSGYYSIQPADSLVESSGMAFDKGIQCILKTQYIQNGILTSWCAQHDEKTLMPAKARAYELPSLSGSESAKIVLLLMKIENPSDQIINAVNHAVEWFKKVKITGLREERSYNDKGKVVSKKMVRDDQAEPLWARFMELDDNRPFFCDRDGVKKYALSEIGAERRNGYAWYVNTPKEVLKKYEKWQKKHVASQKATADRQLGDKYSVTVSLDGTGDYTSIQAAIDGAKSFPPQRVIIHVRNGTYKEKIKIHEWNTRISLIGESKDSTIITYDDYFDKMEKGRNSTFYTYTLLVEGDEFYASNLTVENSSGRVGQAVALSVFADKVVIENCRLLGNQDTLYISGNGNRQFFESCYIEGTTDFIFGGATALFENCNIHSKENSYITAASTPQDVSFGFVFLNCSLTAEEGLDQVYLGRPWRNFAQTAWINCSMGKHIRPEGWHNWKKKDAETTVFYAEYNSTGPGAAPQERVDWSYQLTPEQAEGYTKENILGKDQWYYYNYR